MNTKIVFFDGYCVLCNSFVDFLLEKDSGKNLKLASLQGKTAQKLLPPSYLYSVDSVIYIDKNHKILVKSEAVIDILKTIGGPWKLISIFSLFPSFILDKLYDLLAKNRYNWFGKRNQCRLPTSEEKERLLP